MSVLRQRAGRGAASASGVGLALALALAVTASGCWYKVESYCPGCTVVDHAKTAVPAIAPGTRTEVVLVHGARGFGGEWHDVIGAVKRSPGFGLIAWSWPGPFDNPARDTHALEEELQALLDSLPPSVDEVIVLAHSAGGIITNLAMRKLHVPAGRHMTVALLDPPLWRPPADRAPDPALPAGIRATAFYAREPPTPAEAAALVPSTTQGTDLPREFLGAIGHDPMVAKASLPILAARAASTQSAAAP